MATELCRAISNSDPNVFYPISMSGKKVSDGGKGIEFSCKCAGNLYHGAFCIHIMVLLYCAKKGQLPHGYFISQEGRKYFGLPEDDRIPRVDLEPVVKHIREVMKARKQKRGLNKVQRVRRNVEHHRVAVNAAPAQQLLDKVKEVIETERIRLLDKVDHQGTTFRLYPAKTGYRMEGGDLVADVDIFESDIKVYRVVGPRQREWIRLFNVPDMPGYLRQHGTDLAKTLAELITSPKQIG